MIRMCLFALCFVCFAGCSEPKNKEITPQPVTGRILYDGKAAVGVNVTLIPTDAPMVPRIPQNPYGVTDAEGAFTITTFSKGDGAAEGGYQLVLAWPVDQSEKAAKGGKVDSSDEAQDIDRLMGWYDPLHSSIQVRVKPGQNEIPTIKIPLISQAPPVSEGVPGRN